jgi:hypothetical protein
MSESDPSLLNLDSVLAWDPACPVMLPLGAVTMSPIIPASLGVLIPFLIFAIAQFYFLYGIWRSNASPDGDSSSIQTLGTTTSGLMRTGRCSSATPMRIQRY